MRPTGYAIFPGLPSIGGYGTAPVASLPPHRQRQGSVAANQTLARGNRIDLRLHKREALYARIYARREREPSRLARPQRRLTTAPSTNCGTLFRGVGCRFRIIRNDIVQSIASRTVKFLPPLSSWATMAVCPRRRGRRAPCRPTPHSSWARSSHRVMVMGGIEPKCDRPPIRRFGHDFRLYLALT
jgi:hypothetical protein